MRISFRKSTTFSWFAALSVVLWSPQSALACAVCGAVQQEATRKAFIGTTAFMTFLALGAVFLLVGWFIRRTLQREEEDARQALDAQHEQALDSAG